MGLRTGGGKHRPSSQPADVPVLGSSHGRLRGGSGRRRWIHGLRGTAGEIPVRKRLGLFHCVWCWVTHVLPSALWWQDPATCAALGSPDFNVSRGTAAGTVVFTVVGNAPADAIGLCVDYNADIGQLELYQCYK